MHLTVFCNFQHGAILTKVHEVVEFHQTKFIQSYMEKLFKIRNNTKLDTVRTFMKLMGILIQTLICKLKKTTCNANTSMLYILQEIAYLEGMYILLRTPHML